MERGALDFLAAGAGSWSTTSGKFLSVFHVAIFWQLCPPAVQISHNPFPASRQLAQPRNVLQDGKLQVRTLCPIAVFIHILRAQRPSRYHLLQAVTRVAVMVAGSSSRSYLLSWLFSRFIVFSGVVGNTTSQI